MNGWLLDESVLLELGKPSPDPRVTSWSNAQPRESLFLSAVTIAAIRRGMDRRCDARLRTEIDIWIDQSLKPWFGSRLLPLTEDIVLEWLRIRDQEGPPGGGPGQTDLLLAATARVHRLTVCTGDDRAFQLAGVPLFNPWSASRP